MSVKERILKFLDIKGISVTKAETLLGWSKSALLKSNNVSGDKIAELIHLFPELSADWLLTGQGDMLKSNIDKSKPTSSGGIELSSGKYPAKPFIDSAYAVCGIPSGFSIAVKADECETISLPLFVDYDFSIRGKGDSMINYDNPERTIMPGDFIACRLWSSRSHIRWGEVYALATVDGVVVKKIMPSDKNDCVKCVSFNEKEGYLPYDLSLEEIQDWAIVVGIVGAKRWN